MKQVKLIISATLLIMMSQLTIAQNLVFSDNGFRNYLLQANCVDTNGDSFGDVSADVNSDGEIQLSEALNVYSFTFENTHQFNDVIYDIQDLNYFANLKRLSIMGSSGLSISNITGLNLDSLKFLSINNLALYAIDLSDVNNLDSLYIHSVIGLNGGASGLEFLDVKNGNYPTGVFSLFYTENIVGACVDSIAAEYNEVVQHMLPPNLPEVNCLFVGEKENATNSVKINLHPIPITDIVNIITELKIKKIEIIDICGEVVFRNFGSSNVVDLRELKGGIYCVTITFESGERLSKQIVKLSS